MAMVSSKPLQRIPGITVLLMEWKSHESDEVNDEMANVLVAQILYLANQDKGVTDQGFQRPGTLKMLKLLVFCLQRRSVQIRISGCSVRIWGILDSQK